MLHWCTLDLLPGLVCTTLRMLASLVKKVKATSKLITALNTQMCLSVCPSLSSLDVLLPLQVWLGTPVPGTAFFWTEMSEMFQAFSLGVTDPPVTTGTTGAFSPHSPSDPAISPASYAPPSWCWYHLGPLDLLVQHFYHHHNVHRGSHLLRQIPASTALMLGACLFCAAMIRACLSVHPFSASGHFLFLVVPDAMPGLIFPWWFQLFSIWFLLSEVFIHNLFSKDYLSEVLAVLICFILDRGFDTHESSASLFLFMSLFFISSSG